METSVIPAPSKSTEDNYHAPLADFISAVVMVAEEKGHLPSKRRNSLFLPFRQLIEKAGFSVTRMHLHMWLTEGGVARTDRNRAILDSLRTLYTPTMTDEAFERIFRVDKGVNSQNVGNSAMDVILKRIHQQAAKNGENGQVMAARIAAAAQMGMRTLYRAKERRGLAPAKAGLVRAALKREGIDLARIDQSDIAPDGDIVDQALRPSSK